MANKTRYDTNGLEEGSFEPGSHGRVLKNKLGITRKRDMDEVETREHFRALNIFLETYDNKHRFTAKDICHMHKTWLENIYSWAGKNRHAYFAAVQAGMSYDYSPMENIFKKVLKRSFQLSQGG